MPGEFPGGGGEYVEASIWLVHKDTVHLAPNF